MARKTKTRRKRWLPTPAQLKALDACWTELDDAGRERVRRRAIATGRYLLQVVKEEEREGK